MEKQRNMKKFTSSSLHINRGIPKKRRPKTIKQFQAIIDFEDNPNLRNFEEDIYSNESFMSTSTCPGQDEDNLHSPISPILPPKFKKKPKLLEKTQLHHHYHTINNRKNPLYGQCSSNSRGVDLQVVLDLLKSLKSENQNHVDEKKDLLHELKKKDIKIQKLAKKFRKIVGAFVEKQRKYQKAIESLWEKNKMKEETIQKLKIKILMSKRQKRLIGKNQRGEIIRTEVPAGYRRQKTPPKIQRKLKFYENDRRKSCGKRVPKNYKKSVKQKAGNYITHRSNKLKNMMNRTRGINLMTSPQIYCKRKRKNYVDESGGFSQVEEDDLEEQIKKVIERESKKSGINDRREVKDDRRICDVMEIIDMMEM